MRESATRLDEIQPTVGSQHPSPNVTTLCNFEPQTWAEIITSCDADSTCFKGSRTSCDVIFFGDFEQIFGHEDDRGFYNVTFEFCSFCTVPRIDCQGSASERPPKKAITDHEPVQNYTFQK